MTEIDVTKQGERRDFMVTAALAFAGVGSAIALWPFIDQMNPNSGTPPPETREVDLRPIEPGQAIHILWRGKPIVIRHRTAEEVEAAQATNLSDLIDPFARNEMLPSRTPAIDANRTKVGHERWIVVVGLCTHLNCLLKVSASVRAVKDDDGWFCPCHAARFDVSGRVRGGPARTNLPVPPYQFVEPFKIRIGG